MRLITMSMRTSKAAATTTILAMLTFHTTKWLVVLTTEWLHYPICRQAEKTVVMRSLFWLIAYATWAQIIPYNWEYLGGNHFNDMLDVMQLLYLQDHVMVYSLLHSCSRMLPPFPLYIPPCITTAWTALRLYYLHSHDHAHKPPSAATADIFSELEILHIKYAALLIEYRWMGCRLYNHAVVQSVCDLDWKTLDLHFTQ